ncbi:MAG: dihydroorotase [Gammaproteobacteria bacterium]|nr:dihydroorotase [Gammaproteobacteria bacterium]
MSEYLTLLRPDDWHLHLRDGDVLRDVLPHTAERFARAVIMPNLKPAITTTALASEYRSRILAALPVGSDFQPLMTLYLTDHTPVTEIDRAHQSGFIVGCKLYPSGVTTHSDAGVTDIRKIDLVLERMSQLGLVLQVHGEVTDLNIDIFDREHYFIDTVLAPLVLRHPKLPVVFEHITSSAAVHFVTHTRTRVGATITPQHLLYNRNEIFKGGIRPHFYCLPILKTEKDRIGLLAAATSGNPRFFLGTDSAPHARHTKESACGCAGMYSAHASLELYLEAFENAGALEKFEGFASKFGPDFYSLPRNIDTLILQKKSWIAPASYIFGSDEIIPMHANQLLRWQIK